MNRQMISLIKRVFGLNSSQTLSMFNVIKKIHLKLGHFVFRKKYGTKEIIDSLMAVGICQGDNVFIHSSWDEFYNYQGNVEELIKAIVDYIGPQGTVAMPAIPFIRKRLFDVRKTVTKAGILPESFRKYKGVERSPNVRHSVCAFGPLAHDIVCTHNMSKIRFDENSPFYKMCTHNFKVVSLGLPTYFLGTIIHCVEATMYKELPYFKSFYDFNAPLVEFRYIDALGEEQVYYEIKDALHPRGNTLRSQRIINRYFDKSKLNKTRISNLQIGCSESGYVYKRLCELAKKGVIIYEWPKIK